MKKKHTMIFKVDFEKAYDSVRWDYLDDVLKRFRILVGTVVGSSLQVSHLFYADDAVFMGHWSEANIDTILRVLDCFYHASGLRINMLKSKLMGISVSSDKVDQAAKKNWMGSIYSEAGIDVIGFIHRKVWAKGRPFGSWGGQIEGRQHFPIHVFLIIAPRAGAEELQYIQLVKIMEGITLFDSKDRWRWSLEGCGEFTSLRAMETRNSTELKKILDTMEADKREMAQQMKIMQDQIQELLLCQTHGEDSNSHGSVNKGGSSGWHSNDIKVDIPE
ncbi:hypothetical protein Tco_0401754 [Tanacetum coccineum]